MFFSFRLNHRIVPTSSFENRCNSQRPFVELDELTKLNPEQLYKRFMTTIVIHNDLIHCSSNFFKELGLKLNKTNKAVYLMLKRIHDKNIASTSKSVNVEFAQSYCSDYNETPECKVVEEKFCTVKEEKRDSDAIEPYRGEFPNAEIFEIDSRNEKHRNNIVTRSYVKSGWTSKLAAFLFNETGRSCKYEMKRAWVVNDGTIRTKGNCYCGSKLDVSSDLKTLHVSITNFRKDFNHDRKYQARGKFKEKLEELLKNKTAHAAQVQVVNEIIPNSTELKEAFDPLTPGLNALNLLRCRQNNTDQDPVDAILDLEESELCDVISAVMHSPFGVFYQTPLQRAFYIAESRKHDMSLSADATENSEH